MDPTRPPVALLVVDATNDFVAKGGFFDQLGFPVDTMRAALPGLVTLAEGCRAAGVPTIHVRAIYDRAFLAPAMAERFDAMGLPDGLLAAKGTWGSEVVEELPGSPDLVVLKSHYSAFAPGRSLAYRPGAAPELEADLGRPIAADPVDGPTLLDRYASASRGENGLLTLEGALRELGIEELLLGGFSTHVCVAAAAYGGHERGFGITVVEDATAGEDEDRQRIYLDTLGQYVARTATTASVLRDLG